jgi:hypothetical protein
MKKNTLGFSSSYCLLFPFHKRKSMFAVLHSDINYLESGLLHLNDLPYCKKSRSTKVKDAIINLILMSYLIDQYRPESLDGSCLTFHKLLVIHKGFLISSACITQST